MHPTFLVCVVPGHAVPMKNPDGSLVMGRFVGYGPDGKPVAGSVPVLDTPYYRDMVLSGALTEPVEAPVVPVESAPAEAAPVPESEPPAAEAGESRPRVRRPAAP